MKMISTLAVITGSINVSLLCTTYYNYQEWPPIAFIVLSFAYIGVILIMEYEYRRFRILQPESIQETANIFQKYLYFFVVGTVVAVIKLGMDINQPNQSELHFESYILVRCFDEKTNIYFNLLYYLSNYLMGTLYLNMFRDLYAKYKNRVMNDLDVTQAVSSQVFTCAICMNDVNPGFKTILLACTHQFHQSCAKKWLLHKGICPLCKLRVDGLEQTEC